MSICFHERKGHAGPEMGSECRDELRRAIATYDGLLRCAYDSTTIRVGDDIRCKETFQCSEISFAGGSDEHIEKSPLLGRTHRPSAPISDMLPGAGNKLPCIVFSQVKDVCDLLVCIVECFPQDVRRPFSGSKLFQQQQP